MTQMLLFVRALSWPPRIRPFIHLSIRLAIKLCIYVSVYPSPCTAHIQIAGKNESLAEAAEAALEMDSKAQAVAAGFAGIAQNKILHVLVAQCFDCVLFYRARGSKMQRAKVVARHLNQVADFCMYKKEQK